MSLAQAKSQELTRVNAARAEAFNGSWVINESLSDNTDDAVEAAIKEAGGKVKRRFLRKRPEDFYRGGPAEQELYDRISYDDVLFIAIEEPELRFEYADNFVRLFHSDGRRRRTTANSFYEEGAEDFSFANWNGNSLIVESRPRDGGFTLETYTLINNGARLRIELQIEPDSFGAAVELVRIFDRVNAR
ncbi:MAG: hypothetical protein NWR63_08760 [OM182 bacterium]|nr:hypothetical protein [OM182 bacterium]